MDASGFGAVVKRFVGQVGWLGLVVVFVACLVTFGLPNDTTDIAKIASVALVPLLLSALLNLNLDIFFFELSYEPKILQYKAPIVLSSLFCVQSLILNLYDGLLAAFGL